jgi:hypothetical protein
MEEKGTKPIFTTISDVRAGNNDSNEVLVAYIVTIKKTDKRDPKGHVTNGEFDRLFTLMCVNETGHNNCFIIKSGNMSNKELIDAHVRNDGGYGKCCECLCELIFIILNYKIHYSIGNGSLVLVDGFTSTGVYTGLTVLQGNVKMTPLFDFLKVNLVVAASL